MRNKPNWNSSSTSILDTLVSQKRSHKPKTSTSMLWIGGGKSGVAFPSSYVIAMTQHIITSFIILIYILHPCAASLKSHNSEESSQFSTITHQSNVSRQNFKDIVMPMKQKKYIFLVNFIKNRRTVKTYLIRCILSSISI